MKKNDLLFAALLAALFVPFFVSKTVLDVYIEVTKQHALVMSFVKFAVLATLGEIIGLRISEGIYLKNGFGILPRAFFWGLTGVLIKIAFTIFAAGAPVFIDHNILALPQNVMGGELSTLKLVGAVGISVTMNLMFAPIFMICHKVSDIHILETGGTLRGYFSSIDISGILKKIDWSVMWGFVFKKTLPLFWVPAHTITFLLPPIHQVLFAALLGIVLGIILSVAGKKKNKFPQTAVA